MGGKSDFDEPESARVLAQLGQDLFRQTDPLRQAVIGQAGEVFGLQPGAQGGGLQLPPGAFVQGDRVLVRGPSTTRTESGFGRPSSQRTVTVPGDVIDLGPVSEFQQAPAAAAGGEDVLGASLPSPILDAIRTAQERQFQNARENIIASTPRGGALTGALAELEGAQATSLSQAIGQQLASERSAARNLALGAPTAATSALSGAGGIQAQLAAAEAERGAGKASALGTGLGSFAGLKAAGK